MAVSSIFFTTVAQAVLTGFFGDAAIMDMCKKYLHLQKAIGANVVNVPIWQDFTVYSMGSECFTPCEDTKVCEEATADIIQIELMTRFIPTPICLSDLNIMSSEQKAGMIEKIAEDLMADFEVGGAFISVFDVLWTDAVFNGAAGGMPPIILTDTAAAYRQLSTAIHRAKSKARIGDEVAFIVPNALAGFIDSIPDRPIERLVGETSGLKYHVIGNSDTFARTYGGTLYTGRIGFVYPKSALAYAAPSIQSPNDPWTGVYGNMWATALDDTEIPGKMFYFAHQYGLRVVRAGDVQMIIAP
jgi:hypothetical protein